MSASLPPVCLACGIEALLVVDFDVDVGQVVTQLHPAGALSAAEARRIAMLALPDSQASGPAAGGDLLYTFRLRRDDVPLFAASALTHDFAFGAALFRQRRDAAVRRGFVQCVGGGRVGARAATARRSTHATFSRCCGSLLPPAGAPWCSYPAGRTLACSRRWRA
jgi:hypothetical protein